MVTQSQRDKTIQEHVRALTSLNTRYQGEFLQFLNVAKKYKTNDVGNFVFDYLPRFNAPFQQASRTVGQRFLDIRAEQSGLKDKVPDIRDFAAYGKKLEADNLSAAGLMKSLILKQREGYNTTDNTIVKAMERPITEADRAVVLTLATDFDAIEEYVVGVRSDGCKYCQNLSVRGVMGQGRANFHNNCRCVFDPQFKTDPAFTQSFHNDFKEQYAEAEEAIKNGDVEPRVLSTRSREWEAQQKRDVKAKLRAERKIWEEDYKPSAAEKTSRREEEDSLVEDIMSKAMTGQKLNENQVKALQKGDGSEPFDVESLYKPIHRPWKTTDRDIIKLMQSKNSKEVYGLEQLFKR